MSMSHRLKQARLEAGYRSATDAIAKFKFNSSAYRAHENGQNNFKIDAAEKYAKAYGVSSAWLLLGDQEVAKVKNKSQKIYAKYEGLELKEIAERVYAIALLLRDDADSQRLVQQLNDITDLYMNRVKAITE